LKSPGLTRARSSGRRRVGGRWKSDYLAGIGRKGDGFVIIFDLARLMASSDDMENGTLSAVAA
jgi:hypothetical protein